MSSLTWVSTAISNTAIDQDQNTQPTLTTVQPVDEGQAHVSHQNQVPDALNPYCTFVLEVAEAQADTSRDFKVKGIDEQGSEIEMKSVYAGFPNNGKTTYYVQFKRTVDHIVAESNTLGFMYYNAELTVGDQTFTWNIGQKMDRPKVSWLVNYDEPQNNKHVCFLHFGEGGETDTNTLRHYLTDPNINAANSAVDTAKKLHDKILEAFFTEENNISALNREIVMVDPSDPSGYKAVEYDTATGAITVPLGASAYSELDNKRGLYVRFELKDMSKDGCIAKGGKDLLTETGEGKDNVKHYKSLEGVGVDIHHDHDNHEHISDTWLVVYIIVSVVLGAVLCYLLMTMFGEDDNDYAPAAAAATRAPKQVSSRGGSRRKAASSKRRRR